MTIRLMFGALVAVLLVAQDALAERLLSCGPAPVSAFAVYQGYGPYSECRIWGTEGIGPDDVTIRWCTNSDIQIRFQALAAWNDVCAAAAYSADGNIEAAERTLGQAAIRCQLLDELTETWQVRNCDCDRAEWWSDVSRFSP